MIAPNERQRAGRIHFWLLAIPAVVVGSLAGYYYFLVYLYNPPPPGDSPSPEMAARSAPMPEPDAELLRELQSVSLRVADPPAVGGDWPQWRGPNRDGVSSETGLLTQWPKEGPRQVWHAKGGGGFSSFAVVDARVFTILQDGADETVVCWDADKGQELWRFRYPASFENDFGPGPRATPSVDNGLVYTIGATGLFHCLKADSGEKVWRHDLLAEFGASNLQWGVSFSPLIEGDLVLTNPGGPNGSSIAAFDKKTGKLVWKALDDPPGYSSPVDATIAGARQVIFLTARGLVSVSPTDGKELWRFDWNTEFDANIATPIVVDDYVFISSGYNKGAALVKVEADGKDRLKARLVYVSKQIQTHFSSSVYYKEHLYGFTDPGLLFCMEFRTGKVLWKERGFEKGSLTIADDHLIFLGENGTLALAEANPKEYREKARCQPFENKCWTVPVLANGKLYLRDEEKVLCLEMRRVESRE